MSVPHRRPTGVTVVCVLVALDALLNLDNVVAPLLGETPFPYPIAVAIGLVTLGQVLAQLFTVHGLYLLKPRAWNRTVGALKGGLLVDFLGLFTGNSGPLDLALTVVALAYLFAYKDSFVRAKA